MSQEDRAKTKEGVAIRPFSPSDYSAARALWGRCEGVGLSEADEQVPLLAYLHRNPGLSHVAVDGGAIIGTILVGHDGRRGLIHHLAVADTHRRRDIGRKLVEAGMAALKGAGIGKCHLLVFETNTKAHAFWQAIGAQYRDDLRLFSLTVGPT